MLLYVKKPALDEVIEVEDSSCSDSNEATDDRKVKRAVPRKVNIWMLLEARFSAIHVLVWLLPPKTRKHRNFTHYYNILI